MATFPTSEGRKEMNGEEEPPPTVGEDAPDYSTPWGRYRLVDTERWCALMPERGMVFQCALPNEFMVSEDFELAESGIVEASFVVVDKSYLVDGSMKVDVKSLGCSSTVMHQQLSNIFNRKNGAIHLCSGVGLCDAPPECKFHLSDLWLHPGTGFTAPYMGSSGKKILKQVLDSICGPEVGGTPRQAEDAEMGAGGTRKGKGGVKPKDNKGKTREEKADQLRRRLAEIQKKKGKHAGDRVEEVEEEEETLQDGSEEDSGSDSVEELALRTSTRLPELHKEIQEMTKADGKKKKARLEITDGRGNGTPL